jgi:hypothetical protein
METEFIPHRRHYISTTNTNQLLLFREIITVYYKKHAKRPKCTSVGRMQSFFYVKAGDTYSECWTLKA